MKKHLLWLAAFVLVGICLVESGAFGQIQPVVTGGFPKTGPTGTVVLVNQSSLPDDELARIANALSQRVANVAVATRLSGNGCFPGEWCVYVNNEMLGHVTDSTAASAAIGSEVTRAIIARVVQW